MSLIILTAEEAEEYRKKEEREFQEAFLRECERRAGASYEKMWELLKDHARCDTAEWLWRILGGKP